MNSTSAPDVAVVMPVLNGADHIGLTLEAVARQTYPVSDVVVVDDGCTDDSVEIASGFDGVRVVRNEGKGLDPARVMGLTQVDTPLVALLDHDDPWHPDHIRLMVEALGRHPEACAAVSHAQPFLDGQEPPFDEAGLDLELANPWDIFPGCFTRTPSGAVMRREALDAVGGWPTKFWPTGELYIWLRLFEWGPYVVNQRTTVGYRVRAKSLSAQQRRDSAAEFVELVASAAQEAVSARAARFPDESPSLAKRDSVARAVRHIGRGLFSGGFGEIERGAHLLEDGTRDEPAERVQRAFEPLFWLVEGHSTAPGVESDVWRPLIAEWPASAVRTAPYRLRFNSISHLLRSALRHPSATWRWRWLSEVARSRVRGGLPA